MKRGIDKLITIIKTAEAAEVLSLLVLAIVSLF